MDNYEYCARIAAERCPPNGRILDFGCGAGQVVGLLRRRGHDAFGCDVFYEGGNYAESVPAELKDVYVKPMTAERLPFDDASFDFIFCNQVMEHVVDLDVVLREIRRVIKPGGQFLSLFPDDTVWREGHIGIVFVHWLPAMSRVQIAWATLGRALGAGYHAVPGQAAAEWARQWCQWLRDWTYYRPYEEIRAAYGRHFGPMTHLESHWLATRYPHRAAVYSWWPGWLKRLVVTRLAGMIFVVAAGQAESGVASTGTATPRSAAGS